MTTIFDVIFTYKIAGILPLWIPIVLFAIGFIIWLVITRKPRVKEFKGLDMSREVKKDYDIQYKYFSNKVGKVLFYYHELTGRVNVGWVMGVMPIIWTKRLKKLVPMKKYTKDDFNKLEKTSMEIYKKSFNDLGDEQKKGIRETVREESGDTESVEIISDEEKMKFKYGKKEVSFDENIPVLCFKVCLNNFFNKLFTSFLGIGTRYFTFDEDQIQIKGNDIQIQTDLPREPFFNNFIFSKAGKSITENITFRINRQSELQEIGNDVARTIFWDNEFRKRAILIREQAETDAKRFRSQKESQQD